MVTANTGLLISQWAGATRLKALLDVWLAAVNDELVAPLLELDDMRSLDTARGVYLDYLGERLGVERPYVPNTFYMSTFGFHGHGVGWEQGRMAALEHLEAQTPLFDRDYRRLLKARAETDDFGGCTVGVMRRAVAHIDTTAVVTDNHDMTVTVHATEHALLLLADQLGALPRPAGVRMLLDEHSPLFVTSGNVLVTSGNWGVASGGIAV